MPRSYLDQAIQVAASATYDDGVSSPHTAGVAEGQTQIEGDMNVLRTLLKDLIGETNWFDQADLSVAGIYDKQFIQSVHLAGFDNVSVTGANTTAFDAAIKTLSDHNNGGGTSTISGVIINSTLPYKCIIRDHATLNPIDDGAGNEVYGRISWTGTQYQLTFYSWVNGTETAYTFAAATDIDLGFIPVSRKYQELSWERFIDPEFHDSTGFTGTIDDSAVTTGPWSFLLSGDTTAAQAFDKLDKLGSTANGEGASGIAIEDASLYYTGSDVEALFNELETQIGGDTSTTFNFTENNVLLDHDPIYAALNKLDLKWGDLATTNTGEGASLVGVEDVGGYYVGADVEAVLQEIGQQIEDVAGWEKLVITTSSPITSGSNYTLPSSGTYTLGTGAHLDVYDDGQLLTEGASNDYQEISTTQVSFNYTVPTGTNLTFMIRK